MNFYKTQAVGLPHHGAAFFQEKFRKISSLDDFRNFPIRLVADPKNPRDRNAVRIIADPRALNSMPVDGWNGTDDIQIGFIPRHAAGEISALLLTGEKIDAVLRLKNGNFTPGALDINTPVWSVMIRTRAALSLKTFQMAQADMELCFGTHDTLNAAITTGAGPALSRPKRRRKTAVWIRPPAPALRMAFP